MIKDTLENIVLKTVNKAIYIVDTIAYEKQGNVFVRKGKTQLERTLRGLIYIPAYVITIVTFLICNGLNKLVGGK